MNRFQMLRVFVLMTLRGREVPLQDLIVEYGMETELQEMILELEERVEKRCNEYFLLHNEWEPQVHLTPVYDPAPVWWDREDEYETQYELEEIYEGPPELQDRMDRAKRRHDRLYCAVGTLKLVLNPAEKWEGIPF